MFQQCRKKFFRYVIPSMVSLWVYALYTMADGIFVARGVGPDALAAVNLCIPFNCFVLALGTLFAMGSSTKMSIVLGKGDNKEAGRIFSQNTVTVAVVGAAFSALVLWQLDLFARLLGAQEATLAYTKEYLHSIAMFAVCFMISYNLEIQVKADGSPMISTLGNLASGLTNIGLDALFVLRFGWGIKGAAIATGLSQAASMLLFLSYFLWKSKKIRFAAFRFQWKHLRETIVLGVSGFVGELDASFTSLLYNRVIAHVAGSTGLIAYTVVAYVQTFAANTMMGISQGVCPLISYSRGAQQTRQEQSYRKMTLWTIGIVGGATILLTECLAGPITGIYLNEAHAAYSVAVNALRIYAPAFILIGYALFSINDFMAIGRGGLAFRLSLCSLIMMCVFVVALGLLFGATGVWVSATAAKAGYLLIVLAVLRKSSNPN